MTADDLRELKNKTPFAPFTIHMNDGKSLKVEDPEDILLPRGWRSDVIVTYPNGRWSWIYLKNISHVTGAGRWPNGRRRGGRED